jgi:SAM-dependent methyltransferase
MSPVAPELQQELERPPAWMFPWELGPGLQPPLLGSNLPPVHRTRLELMEGPVRAALAAAGPDATALDLACCEGWFSHRLLEWGAGQVVGVDLRELNIRRAELVRDHFGIPESRLRFMQSDVFDLDLDVLGQFDVVLVLGLIYHLEDPVGAIRRARALTRGLCVVESQLTRQERPIVHGNGSPGLLLTAQASFAAMIEPDAEHNQLASAPGILSLVPNRTAFEQIARVAGFEHVEIARPRPDHDRQYVLGDRAVLLAR